MDLQNQRSDAKTWMIEETRTLIEFYRKNKHMWDPKDLNYKNKLKKMDSLNHLACIFSTSPDTIDRKWKNLISQYQREKRLIAKKSRSGKSHRSKWFCFKAMSFIDAKNVESGLDFELFQDPLQEQVIVMSPETWRAPSPTSPNSDHDMKMRPQDFDVTENSLQHTEEAPRDNEDFSFGRSVGYSLAQIKDRKTKFILKAKIMTILGEALD